MRDPLLRVSALRVSPSHGETGSRVVPEEVPVALVYEGGTHAVMMATPANLEDMAYGFSLTEGIIAAASEIRELDIVEQSQGVELRMWLTGEASRRVIARRRAILGPTGCGLCGVESLEAALPTLRPVESVLTIKAADIWEALSAVSPYQVLNVEARALHAAGLWSPRSASTPASVVVVREDVGRHNALDKLVGATARLEGVQASECVLVLTSRVSVELVQKAAVLRVPIMVAVSAPTALAIRTAEAAGITLIGIARADSFEVFTHHHRIIAAPLNENRASREQGHYAAS